MAEVAVGQGETLKAWALALTDEALAMRLRTVVVQPRRFIKAERDALMLEAAARLAKDNDAKVLASLTPEQVDAWAAVGERAVAS